MSETLNPAYYVSQSGNDASDGSLERPFATLGRAQQAMENSAVRTTQVENGTYDLSNGLHLTSRDNGMSFIAAGGQRPVLAGGGGNLVTLDGTSNVTLQGLAFENARGSQGAVFVVNASWNVIAGNLFASNDIGVVLNGSAHNLVSGNEIDGSVTGGVVVGGGSSGNTIDSNRIDGTALIGTGTGSAGVMLTGGTGNTVSHNQVQNTAGAGIALLNWDASSQNLGDVIAGNVITNADSASGATDSGGIYMLGRRGGDTGTQIVNNFVSLASQPVNGNDVDIYLDDLASGVTVKNNILKEGNFAVQIHGGHDDIIVNNIFDMGPMSAANIGAALIQSGNDGSMYNDVVSQNIIYSTAASAPTVWVTYGGTAAIANNLYYNANGQPMDGTYGDNLRDGSMHYGNPGFGNPGAGDFTLGSGSTAGSGSAAGAIGFSAIDQGSMGLAPATAHWY